MKKFGLISAITPFVIALCACGGNGKVSEPVATDASPKKAALLQQVNPLRLDNDSRIATSFAHTVALATDGMVFSWGFNGTGALGTSDYLDSTTPRQISGLSNVRAVSVGQYHSAALRGDGTVWTWGFNADGQLGVGSGSYSIPRPTLVSGLSDVAAIASNSNRTLALRKDGNVWGWGSSRTGSSNRPVVVSNLSNVKAIAAGDSANYAIKSDGSLWAWGANNYGQLGNGSTFPSSTPIQVLGLSGVRSVAGGMYHGLALTSDGKVWAWGTNTYGQLGIANYFSPVAQQVLGLSGVKSISAGAYHSVAVLNSGRILSWGLNYYGAFGSGSYVFSNSTPTEMLGVNNATSIAAGYYHTMFISSTGDVFGTGYNYYGQLGTHTTSNTAVPLQTVGVRGVGNLKLGTNTLTPSN